MAPVAAAHAVDRKRSTSINAPSPPAIAGAVRPMSGRKAPSLDRILEIIMNASNKSTTRFGIPQLPARYGALVTPLLLSILMTCIVSLISTLRSLGMSPQFVSQWLGAWGISWLVAFPVLLLVLPVVRKTTAVLVRAT
ncbi:DUF2798 domain-containing protein [Flavobacterium sp. MXW15]|uniref:DUF2798 domain-containing protein n=1 Tax=Xanthomonas chitinilytica TaxID=2989819 RepID=A0ABT3JUZ9_9XANT|nr:DUF2798 domain-containing protein [Xanthomonas sp. H13-6]MCW4453392.1 DUF2798 domain-containing protein [Flavobacterium sp. MXW15]MCW4472255.1 DUF2798 domain-containing protein [Xanthomonas sp. H13-6]